MPRSEAYNLYLSVGSGFHNAQKGQTTLPRRPAGARPLVSEKRLGASGAVYQKNQILLPQQFWNEERYRKSMVFATTFSAAAASAGTGATGGQGCRKTAGREKYPLLLCMENGRASMEKSGTRQKRIGRRSGTARCGEEARRSCRAGGRSLPPGRKGKEGGWPGRRRRAGMGQRHAAAETAASGAGGGPGAKDRQGVLLLSPGMSFAGSGTRKERQRGARLCSGRGDGAGRQEDGRRRSGRPCRRAGERQ